MTDAPQRAAESARETETGSEIPVDAISRAEFDAMIGQEFLVPVADEPALALALEAVVDSPYNKGRPRAEGGEGYHLVLTGPADRYFIQATVPLQMPDGRVCRLFVTNNGPRDGRMHYQVIFN